MFRLREKIINKICHNLHFPKVPSLYRIYKKKAVASPLAVSLTIDQPEKN